MTPVDVDPETPPEILNATPGTGAPSGIEVVIVRVTTDGVIGKVTVIDVPDLAMTSVRDAAEICVADVPTRPPLNLKMTGPVLIILNFAAPSASVTTALTPRFVPSTVRQVTDDPTTASPDGV